MMWMVKHLGSRFLLSHKGRCCWLELPLAYTTSISAEVYTRKLQPSLNECWQSNENQPMLWWIIQPIYGKQWWWFTIALPCFTNITQIPLPTNLHQISIAVACLSQRFLGQLAKGLGEVMDCWAGKTVHSLQECCLDSTCHNMSLCWFSN